MVLKKYIKLLRLAPNLTPQNPVRLIYSQSSGGPAGRYLWFKILQFGRKAVLYENAVLKSCVKGWKSTTAESNHCPPNLLWAKVTFVLEIPCSESQDSSSDSEHDLIFFILGKCFSMRCLITKGRITIKKNFEIWVLTHLMCNSGRFFVMDIYVIIND